MFLHPTSRSVGLLGDRVYFAAADAVLVALDAKPARRCGPPKSRTTRGYYMTLAPLVADGKVMVGASGGELGIRGFVAAFDAETGKPSLLGTGNGGPWMGDQRPGDNTVGRQGLAASGLQSKDEAALYPSQ